MKYEFSKDGWRYEVESDTGIVSRFSNLRPNEVLETFSTKIHTIGDAKGNDKYVEIWSEQFASNVLVKIRPI